MNPHHFPASGSNGLPNGIRPFLLFREFWLRVDKHLAEKLAIVRSRAPHFSFDTIQYATPPQHRRLLSDTIDFSRTNAPTERLNPTLDFLSALKHQPPLALHGAPLCLGHERARQEVRVRFCCGHILRKCALQCWQGGG
jgi:hypothetical protein